MGLKEKAIEIYKKEKELEEEKNRIEAENFAEKSLFFVKDIIGGCYSNITVVTKMPWCTDFNVDGVILRVTMSEGYRIVNVVKTCEICKIEISSRVLNLKDIGKVLTEPHDIFDCNRIFKSKNDPDYDENQKVSSTDLRILEALREFVRENDEMCSGF